MSSDAIEAEAPTAPFVPEATFPPEVDALFRDALSGASVYLEYGSGASTLVAAELGVQRITSVESDAAWAENMRSVVAERGLESVVDVQHADIGPTRRWGKPIDNRGWRRYAQYPLGVWEQDGFAAPDVVLIDGRFRAACLLTTLFKCPRPTTVLFDDYEGRKRYHPVEEFVKPVSMTGRMARFELEPTPFPVDRMGLVMDLFNRFM